MEISYKRTNNESYMVVTTGSWGSDYQERMLKENQIRSLLSFYTMEWNGKIQFWYDISGKQSLKDYMQQQNISFEIMEQILLYMVLACEEIHKYLLLEEKVLLHPENVYVSRQGQFRVYLCYCPFLKEQQTISDMMEYVLQLVDHENEELMQTCYEMYDMTLQEGATLQELLYLVRLHMEKEEPAQKYPEIEESVPEMPGERIQVTDTWDAEENEEERCCGVEGILQQVRRRGEYLKHLILSWFSAEKEELQKRSDVLIEPEPEVMQPTVLLHAMEDVCEGKLLYQGSGDEEDYVIRGDLFRIGYDTAGNEASLKSTAVSRHHARICRKEGAFYLEDLNSTNGTYVNGELLDYTKKYRLDSMDRIAFANVEYMFV